MSNISSVFKAAVVAAIIAPIASSAQQTAARAASTSTGVQRYFLFQGTYAASVDGRTIGDEHAVFKIDSSTGDTWIFISGSKGGHFVQAWSKIDN